MLSHGRLVVLVALFLSILTAVATAAPFAYITNSGTNSVAIIDVATQSVAATVGIGSPAWGVAITPDGAKAYITDQGMNVFVFDTESRGVLKTLAVGSMPFWIAVSPDGSRAYVTRFLSLMATSPSLVVIETGSDSVVGQVAAGRLPIGVAVHPDSTKIYVAVADGLSIVNGGTVTKMSHGTRPFGVAVNGVLKRVYVTNRDSNDVSVFNATDDTWITNIGVGTSPQGIAVSPNGKRVFVANHLANTVTIIDAETNVVLGTFAAGTNPYGLQVSPDGRHVYVANWGSNSVIVLDANTGATVRTISLPAESRPIAFGTFITGIEVQVLSVDIDIMPNGNPNHINLKARGTLPVAILSSELFDATTVDPLTVKLAGASVAMRGNGKPMASFEDVNEDGRLDLMLHVRREELNLSSSDTVAVLEGMTYDGVAITASDSVKIVP